MAMAIVDVGTNPKTRKSWLKLRGKKYVEKLRQQKSLLVGKDAK